MQLEVPPASWKFARSVRRDFGTITGQVPTEFGIARLIVARHVPVALAPMIVQAPAMVALLKRITAGKVTCNPNRPCGCLTCEAIRVLEAIEPKATKLEG